MRRRQAAHAPDVKLDPLGDRAWLSGGNCSVEVGEWGGGTLGSLVRRCSGPQSEPLAEALVDYLVAMLEC